MSHTDSLNLSALTGLLTEECRRLDLPERLITARGAMGGRIVFATSFGIEDQAIAHAIFTAGLEIDVVTSPVSFEADAPDLVIRGDLPKNLTGTLCRNGPNPQFAPRDTHFRWFLGAGMMHAFGIEDGRRFAVSCLGDVALNGTDSLDFSRAFTVFRMRTLRSETNIYAVPYGPRDCPRQACAR